MPTAIWGNDAIYCFAFPFTRAHSAKAEVYPVLTSQLNGSSTLSVQGLQSLGTGLCKGGDCVDISLWLIFIGGVCRAVGDDQPKHTPVGGMRLICYLAISDLNLIYAKGFSNCSECLPSASMETTAYTTQRVSHVTSVTPVSCRGQRRRVYSTVQAGHFTWGSGSRQSPLLDFQVPLGRSEVIWQHWGKDIMKPIFPPLLICLKMDPHACGVSLLPWTGGSSWACAGDSQWVQWFKAGKKKIRKVSRYHYFLYSPKSLEFCYCLHVL